MWSDSVSGWEPLFWALFIEPTNKQNYSECFHFKLLISERQLAAFSALRLSSLILVPFVFMSITIFEIQMKFYVRIFANEDWQNFFFSENTFLFLLLIKIPWYNFSEKIIHTILLVAE